jgi:FkbM family methyltransferase
MIRRLRSTAAYALRRRLGFPLEELALERLQAAGLAPRVIFDVGASHGLFANRARLLWPGSDIHCFEPEPEYAEILTERAKSDVHLHVCPALVGATARPNQAYHFHLGASSVLANAVRAGTGADTLRHARMIALDDYCGEHDLEPDFLKIDVQGYELEVLKGAERVLARIEVVFTEVNHLEVYAGVPLAAELIGWLAERGYALHDVCNLMTRPSDGALWQTDMIFVRHSSPLRASRAW